MSGPDDMEGKLIYSADIPDDPSRMSREELNNIPATFLGPKDTPEEEHFFVCKKCGQAVDMRKMGDVFYHEDEDHKPLAVN